MKRRGKFLSFVFLFLLLSLYQNCSSYRATDGGGVSASTDPSNPSGVPPTGAPCVPADYRAPTMSAPSAVVAEVKSGQGAAGGRVNSTIKVTYQSSNSPSNCSNLAATVVCGMTSPLSNLTYVNASGVRGPVTNREHVRCIPQTEPLKPGDPPGDFLPGKNSVITFQANDNESTVQCISGTATYEVFLTSDGDPNKQSAKQNVTVTFKNNCLPEQLSGANIDAFDQLGTAVAIDGNTAAALAPGDDGADNNANTQKVGAVYVYQQTSPNVWSAPQILRTLDSPIVSDRGSAEDNPTALALKGDTLVIGTEFNNSSAGAVHIFRRAGGVWSQVRKISGSVAGGKFGKSVALTSTRLVVGAPAENGNAGAVYVFDLASFSQISRMTSPVATARDYFGAAVAADDSVIAVGAPGAILSLGTVRGDVFLFDPAGVEFSPAFRVGDTFGGVKLELGSELGTALAVQNGVVMVGAPGHKVLVNGALQSRGAVFVIGSNRNSIQVLTENSANARFGTSVSMSGANAVIGIPELRSRAGAVDLYSVAAGANTYTRVRRVYSQSNAASDQFGFSVAISGNAFISGAKLNSEPFSSSGTVSLMSILVP
jgi:hypothetical protein